VRRLVVLLPLVALLAGCAAPAPVPPADLAHEAAAKTVCTKVYKYLESFSKNPGEQALQASSIQLVDQLKSIVKGTDSDTLKSEVLTVEQGSSARSNASEFGQGINAITKTCMQLGDPYFAGSAVSFP
jgi:hypothetical protein